MNPLQEIISKTLRETAIQLHRGIALKTPIDTGRATSSWNLSENAPDASVTPPLADRLSPAHGIFSVGVAGASPLTKSQAMAVAIGTEQSVSEFPTTVFIANALPYIEDLEAGSSTKAPAGFVESLCNQGAVEALAQAALATI